MKLPFTSNLTWLEDRTILLARHGSHAYGTNIATSDEDFRGVAIPPAEYFHGFLNVFEQAESHKPDATIFDLRKFMRLAADCNPNVLEILYVDDADILGITPAGERLRAARDLFVSRKARHTYSGYAMQQLKRIARHHRWLKNPPNAPPTRAEYDLPERATIPADQLAAAQSAVDKKLGGWELDFIHGADPASRQLLQNALAELLAEMKVTSDEAWRGAARAIGYDENFLAMLDREKRYRQAQRDWEHYLTWQKERNADRASLEMKHGYDTKHAMHLVRLTRMCREILTTGRVIVRRPDREELLAVRAGAWPYEKLVEWAEREDRELEAVAKTSPLPNAPDRVKLDALCQNLTENSLSARPS